jgi:hypothetical protein
LPAALEKAELLQETGLFLAQRTRDGCARAFDGLRVIGEFFVGDFG